MKIWEFACAALDALWANRARSILTMLGIIIGTSAVISIFALGQSAAASIGRTLGAFGTQGLIVLPDQSSRTQNAVQLTWSDYESVRDDCQTCAYVMPFFDDYYDIQEGHNKDYLEVTSDTDYVTDHLPMAEGRRYDAADIAGARNVCNLFAGAKQKLFGDRDALNQTVRIAGQRFTVIGVYGNFSAGIFNSVIGSSDSLTIPYTTYHRMPNTFIVGLNFFKLPSATSSQAIDEVTGILKRIHGPNVKFQSIDLDQQGEAFINVIAYVAVGISAIGGIALVVGGIGVMNIMLVSVMERTREIGIRKAIGASRFDILVQFLMEAVAITLIGGLLGTVFGVAVAGVASGFLDTQFAGVNAGISWFPIIVTALGSSLVIGVFFGTYPAMRASRLEPIECLRHE